MTRIERFLANLLNPDFVIRNHGYKDGYLQKRCVPPWYWTVKPSKQAVYRDGYSEGLYDRVTGEYVTHALREQNLRHYPVTRLTSSDYIDQSKAGTDG